MKSKSFSWEIVIVGLILTIIAIYFAGSGGMKNSTISKSNQQTSDPKTAEVTDNHNLVIDLNNLSDLKKLDTLASDKNIDSLVIDLPNLNKTIKIKSRKTVNDTSEDLVDKINSAITNLTDIINKQVTVAFEKNAIYLRSENTANALISKTFSSDGIHKILLETSGGTIKAQGYEGNKIHVNITSNKKVSKSDFEKAYHIKYSTDGKTLHVNVSRKGSGFNLFKLFEGNTNPANINVEIPQHLSLQAKSAGGYMAASNLQSDVNLHTAGGVIELHHLKGTIHANTSGGLIKADHLTGKINLSTSGGSLNISDASGSLNVSTSGGNIDLTGVEGNINARTSAGNITAHINKLTGNTKFQTSAGNIHIFIPEKSATHFDLSGTRIHVNPNMAINGTVTQGTVKGTLNGGGNTTIHADASIGAIKVN
ncbi:MAG TPA: DUF4097 family beta strand repeat-containing protein [Balneolales bacterium]|nr:DUF4097 family beta strand repeat-containing protein [Balneolales bacterium]